MAITVYPAYESYQDSGVDWIGVVPSDWRIEPGRQCVYENKDKNTHLKETTVLSLSYGRVIVKDEDKLTGLVPESFETYQIVRPGDIIIRGTDLQNDVTSLRTGLAKNVGIITSAYINLRPKSQIDQTFLHYLLHSYDVKKVFYALGSGLRQNLSYLDFKYLKLPIPSPVEQRAISKFLDEKCAGIDEAVRIKEQEVELLRERRQILIQEAVTRGLNPDAPMKDSGVDWIGRIPAHWSVKRLKHLGKIYAGITGKAGDDFSKEPKEGFMPFVPFVSVANFSQVPAKFEYVRERNDERQNKVMKGDLLFLMSSETEEDIARSSLFDLDDVQPFLNSFCKGFRPDQSKLISYFINYLLMAKEYRDYFSTSARGFTRINLKQEYILNAQLLLPPVIEQCAIARFLDKTCGELDEVILIKQDQITGLKEYKTSLINSAVTGKIKVI
jgi:type I restriction enzyme S subunit